MSAANESLLSVRDLSVGFATDHGFIEAVDRVSFDIPRKGIVGLVGESGCGKSVTAQSILRLLPQPSGVISGGSIFFDGMDLAKAPLSELHHIRSRRIGMVFQEPMTALNPVQTIGKQLGEAYRAHFDYSTAEITRRSVEMLRKVGIPSPEIRVREYPHQLSGGMRQRVGIAMALACGPELLIADEPTTALDVTIQAQILSLLEDLREEMGMALLLITHDLGVIAETCESVIVMYAGRIAEQGEVSQIFENPKHPYTRGLLSSIPRLSGARKTRLPTIEGMVPTLRELPKGCRFFNRCPHAQPRCAEGPPPLETVEPGHRASCLRWRELPPLELDLNR